jgi:ankyrin repeat protein
MAHHILQSLFKMIQTRDPLSPEKLAKIQALLRSIPTFAKIREEEILHYQELKKVLGTSVTIPEPISINMKNEVDKNAETLLHDAVYFNHQTLVRSLIIEHGADIHARMSRGETVLMIAAARGHLEFTCEFLEIAKTSLNALTQDNDTALIIAASKPHQKIVDVLVDAKADVNIQGKSLYTALMWAAFNCDLDSARKLIVTGNAKLELTNRDNETALDIAIRKRHFEMVCLLVRHGALIKKPQALFEFILDNYQNDYNILFLLDSLCTQLKNAQALAPNTEQTALLKKANNYLEKLKKLTTQYQNRIFDIIDQTASTHREFAWDETDIIAEYDNPLEHIQSFYPEVIDWILSASLAKTLCWRVITRYLTQMNSDNLADTKLGLQLIEKINAIDAIGNPQDTCIHLVNIIADFIYHGQEKKSLFSIFKKNEHKTLHHYLVEQFHPSLNIRSYFEGDDSLNGIKPYVWAKMTAMLAAENRQQNHVSAPRV